MAKAKTKAIEALTLTDLFETIKSFTSESDINLQNIVGVLKDIEKIVKYNPTMSFNKVVFYAYYCYIGDYHYYTEAEEPEHFSEAALLYNANTTLYESCGEELAKNFKFID